MAHTAQYTEQILQELHALPAEALPKVLRLLRLVREEFLTHEMPGIPQEAAIRHLGQDLDKRTRLCSHDGSAFDKSVLARVRAVRGFPHVSQNALLLQGSLLSTTLLKTEWPWSK